MNLEAHISVGGNAANRSEDALIQQQNTVLLLDADPATRHTVQRVLDTQHLGTLRVADSLEEADELIDSEPTLALLLLSVDGPDDERLQWVRRAIRTAAWQRLSVIVLTPGSRNPLWPEALALNLSDVLGKPLDEAALHLKLRQCLSLKIYRDRLLKQDLLTGLTNRSGFMRRLEVVLRARATAHTVMLLDLDRFRQLNDGLGHHMGDAFLKAVSQRLDAVISHHTGPERRRPAITTSPWLARTGADRFMALLPGRPVNRSRTGTGGTAAQPGAAPAHRGQGTVHLGQHRPGRVSRPRQRPQPAHPARRTGTGRGQAARRPPHRVFRPRAEAGGHQRHYPREPPAPRHPLQRAAALLSAKVCSRTLEITGVEALIRWYHRDRGLILPEHFVPVAERSGLISEIGAWALQEACRQARAWLDAGLPALRMAVNISAAQTQRGDLVATVRQALDDSGLPPEHLTLELTETLLVENGEHARQLIGRLKELGLALSLDDFGTGYSSLTYLHTLPFDEIKIDRSFIQGLPHQAVSRAIVNAILALAEGLELDAVAEGIERPDEFACLQEHLPNCTLQGNLFCPPMSAPALQDRLRASTRFQPAVA